MSCLNSPQHIIGTAFSLQLTSAESPIVQGGLPLANVAGWVPSLQFVQAGTVVREIMGTFASAVTPFLMAFEEADTTLWQAEQLDVRLLIEAPDGRVFAPPQPLVMQLNIVR
jgi:hypothetical protein